LFSDITKKSSKPTSEEILGDEIQSHQHKKLNSFTHSNNTQVDENSNKHQSFPEPSSLQHAISSLSSPPKSEQKNKRKHKKREPHSLGLDDESFRRHNLPKTPKRISKVPKALSDCAIYHVSFNCLLLLLTINLEKNCFMS
jgi:hypothetical protein